MDGAGKVKISKPIGEPETLVVDDTREGWVELISCTIDSYLEEGSRPIVPDTSKVRAYGLPIKGFGGTSSGPEPLLQGYNAIKSILETRIGEYITSTDIVSIMGIIGKIVVAGNVRRCLPYYASVQTLKGLKQIKDVTESDYIVTGGNAYKVRKQVNSGEQETIKIVHRFGELECTPNHRVAVFNKIGQYSFKNASDISIGDRLVWDFEGIDGSPQQLPVLEEKLHFNAKSFTIPNMLNTDIAWLLGIIHGDGYIGPGEIEIVTHENKMEVLHKVERIFNEHFGISGKISKIKDKKAYRFRLHSAALARWFAEHIKQPNTDISVPSFIKNAERSVRYAYLAGVFDSDGKAREDGVVEQCATIYPLFKRDIVSLLASLGIGTTSSYYVKAQDSNRKNYYSVRIVGNINRKSWLEGVKEFTISDKISNTSTKSLIDFSYPVSWLPSKPAGWKKDGNITITALSDLEHKYYPTPVIDITPGEIVETYDIEVDQISQFTTDGIVVHNSALIALGEPEDKEYVTVKNWDKNPVGMGILPPPELKDIDPESYDLYQKDWNAASRIAKHYADEPWSWQFGGWLWASNNSLYAKPGMNYTPYIDSISQNGEPGFAWLDTMRHYGRLKDGVRTDDLKVKGANPCAEIQLESGEVCNLVEVYPTKHDDYFDLQRTLKFAYLYSKAVTLLPTHWKETNAIINRNRRIGASMSGIQEAFIKFGRKNTLDMFDQAYSYINYLDKKYSGWLGVPTSIRKTTVKPSGTVSLLAGSLPGIHHSESNSYYRLVRVANSSELLPILQQAGYKIEPAASDPTRTSVVYFPILLDESLPEKADVSIWRQFKDTRDLQYYWSDNMVSVTVTFGQHEKKQIAECLSAFDQEIKTISLLPLAEHGYVQAPYTSAPRNEVKAYKDSLKPLDFSQLTHEGENAESNKFCTNDVCTF